MEAPGTNPMAGSHNSDVYDGFELLAPDDEWSSKGTLQLNIVVEARINTSFSLHCPPAQTVGWLALVACRRYTERLPKGRRRAAELNHFGGHLQPYTVEHGVDGSEVRQDMKLHEAFGAGDTVVVRLACTVERDNALAFQPQRAVARCGGAVPHASEFGSSAYYSPQASPLAWRRRHEEAEAKLPLHASTAEAQSRKKLEDSREKARAADECRTRLVSAHLARLGEACYDSNSHTGTDMARGVGDSGSLRHS